MIMPTWQELKKHNQDRMVSTMSDLSAEEQLILQEVVKFELEVRHIHKPAFKERITKIIQNTIVS